MPVDGLSVFMVVFYSKKAHIALETAPTALNANKKYSIAMGISPFLKSQ